MKDRIRRIMESQHMTQQVFAQFIKISPATLSGIFNGRTNPSLNIVEAIKNSLPSISTDWLLFGNGINTLADSYQFIVFSQLAKVLSSSCRLHATNCCQDIGINHVVCLGNLQYFYLTCIHIHLISDAKII